MSELKPITRRVMELHAGPRYFVMNDPLQGWQVVDTETDTHTCHCDRESALREARRREEEAKNDTNG